MKCPVCGRVELVHGTRDMPFTYKGQTVQVAAVTADWCDACGESLTGPAESERVMRAMNEFRQQVSTLRDLGNSVGWTTFTCPPAFSTSSAGPEAVNREHLLRLREGSTSVPLDASISGVIKS